MANQSQDKYINQPAPKLTAMQQDLLTREAVRAMQQTQRSQQAQMEQMAQVSAAAVPDFSMLQAMKQGGLVSQTVTPRPKTQYGVPHSELTGASRTVYYVERDGDNLSVGEAYFPIGILDKARHVFRDVRYPCPAFDTKEEAEDHVRAIKRSRLVDTIERLLSETTILIFEQGVAENPETTLLEALQNYLRGVKP